MFNAENIAKNFPYMSVKAVCADYKQINSLKQIINQNENIVGFFPGSTIGNYNPEEAKLLLINFSKSIQIVVPLPHSKGGIPMKVL